MRTSVGRSHRAGHAVEDSEWDRLVAQLKAGRCAPFLGAGACYGSLKLGSQLSEQWADEYDYPFADRGDLAQVMRYVTVYEGDPIYVKEKFLEQDIRGATPPDFSDPCEPHTALARFPIPIYLTTNYDDFMVRALQYAGKKPRQVLCPWYPSAPFHPEDFHPPEGEPPAAHPIVYHLHGHANAPESLVLTEDDYIEFLVALGEERNQPVHMSASPSPSFIPPPVAESLSRMPLLFVGYSLRDWTFQVILQGIVKALPRTMHRRHVSVQMLPLQAGATDDQRRRAEGYLNRYFNGLNISVYWGSAADFFRELDQRAGGMP